MLVNIAHIGSFCSRLLGVTLVYFLLNGDGNFFCLYFPEPRQRGRHCRVGLNCQSSAKTGNPFHADERVHADSRVAGVSQEGGLRLIESITQAFNW